MKEIGVALIGSGLMGRAHSAAYKILGAHLGFGSLTPRLRLLADVDEALARAAAGRFGFEEWTADWTSILDDPRIEVVDIVAPNHLHAEMSIAAAEAGKHVICEKPLARTAEEAATMLDAVETAGVLHMVGFNYRQIPAVQEAARLIAEGAIGQVRHCRGWYLQDFAKNVHVPLSWKFRSDLAGSGALGGIGCHVVDAMRLLVGEFASVSSSALTWVDSRPVTEGPSATFDGSTGRGPLGTVDVDDAAVFLAHFHGGAVGVFEVSRIHSGHRNDFGFEITGSKGAIRFASEEMNELWVELDAGDSVTQGMTRVVIGPQHAYGTDPWPLAGLGVGFLDIVALEIKEFFAALSEGRPAIPSFHDGLRTQMVLDAVLEAAANGQWTEIEASGE